MLYWSACADAASINQAQPTKRSRWKRLFFFSYLYLCIFFCVCISYNCTVHGADLIYISLLIIFCTIVYVTNKNLESLHVIVRPVSPCLPMSCVSLSYQWNLTPATMCRLCSARCMKQTLWSSADHALAQVRPRQMFTCTFSKQWSQMQSQSRALLYIFNYY